MVDSGGGLSEVGFRFRVGRKAVLYKGLFLTCREVSKGLGFGGCGEIWWIEIVEEGPEERMRG